MYDILAPNDYRYVWSVDGREVKNVVIYSDNGIVFTSRSGYLQPLHDPKNPLSYNDEDRFTLKVAPLTARRKVNLTKKENFYVVETGKKATVYLYASTGDNVGVLNIRELQSAETVHDLTAEQIVSTYKIFELTGKHLLQPIFLCECIESKTVTTDIGKKAKELQKYFKEQGFYNLNNEYDIAKLLQICEVTPKA